MVAQRGIGRDLEDLELDHIERIVEARARSLVRIRAPNPEKGVYASGLGG